MQSAEKKESIYKPEDEVSIRIGELVLPFSHPANYRETWFNETKFRLGIDLLGGSIPLRVISSLGVRERNGIELVPYHPEKGYIIDQEDFDLEKRKNKLLEGVRKYGGFGIDEDFPLGLSIKIDADYFVEDGLAVYQGYPDRFNQKQQILYNPIALYIFNTLKCRVILPNSEFEASLDRPPVEIATEWFRKQSGFDDYDFYFGDFYPLETGRLASKAGGTFSMEDDGSDLEVGPGHELYFADNEEELRKIGIEFVLAV